MNNNLTNLLPAERRRALARDFLLRVGVVAVVLVTVLTLVSAIVLIPTYIFLEGSATAKQSELASAQASLSSSNEAALSARLSALSGNAAKLVALSSAPSASTVMREVLVVPRPGVTLTSFSYTPAAGTLSPATLVISGSSSTRDALRNYQLVLQEAPFATSVTLPVSVYANSTDISFAITITLAP